MRLTLIVLTAALAGTTLAVEKADSSRGILPVGADGKPLNTDFETGDLRDWRVEGEAFTGQPIKGDTVFARRGDMRSGHQGDFWIGGYEKHGDQAQGTLTSAPFKVTERWAAFLIGGGQNRTTCVDLVRKDTNQVISHSPGLNQEDMTRVVVDLQAHLGKEIFIRVVDKSSGAWGHVNFDDFRLYAERPSFPKQSARPADLLEFAGLSPDDAAKAMTLPDGFTVTAFAGEPDIVQPIAMTIDDRGRLWVAEAYSYPIRVPDDQARDRILIFEDVNGDGKFDKRTVFADKLNLVSGLEVGFGGVWVGAAPQMLFIPDRDGDDKPDGPPEVLLDGWGYQDTHETLNSFIWGPDGWLYGCHGVFTHSRVGKPGTPNKDRTPINAGIWRYHPTKHKFEVFAYGTSNPWGVDFNDEGHCFLTCCVIPHLFHMIQGARYHRQGGQHFQEYTYADIPTIAKHRHWVGNQWNEADRAKSDSNGGGHAHAGAIIYLGGAWPEKYRNQIFMNNIHGARLNMDVLAANGSGYVGDGAPDFCKTNDLWSQILYLRYGPDGQAYMIDWYDKNQCHRNEGNIHDRSNGRIFKISYQGAKPVQVDLQKLSDKELVAHQLNKNDWYVRQSRRILQERAAAGRLSADARTELEKIAFDNEDITRRLRGLWALHVTGGLTEKQIDRALHDDHASARGWVLQLAMEDSRPSAAVLQAMSDMARGDASPVVRLYIASALQRLPLEQRWDALVGLLSQANDNGDHNLPLMYWYAAEPLAEVNPSRALELAADGNIPLVLEFMIRRVGSDNSPEALDLLVKELAAAKEARVQLTFLRGIQAALKGRRQVAMPKGWSDLYRKLAAIENNEIRTLSSSLAVTFGDPSVLNRLRELVAQSDTPIDQRKDYLATLLAAKDKELVPVLHGLLQEPSLRSEALRGLAGYDDAKTPALLVGTYAALNAGEKRDALGTLSARASYAKELLAAIGEKKIPATDLTADFVRQLRNLKNKELDAQIAAVWGTVRDTPEEKAKLIEHYKQLIAAKPATDEDLPLGRAVFAKICQQCHTLFGTGAKVGPELTGSNRANLDYLLSNVLDPSSVLAREYVPTVVLTTGGRVITGLVKEQTNNALTLVTATETIVIPKSEIEEQKKGDKSMMPDDLLKPLNDTEVRALVGYLASPKQVPLAATAETIATFFNGTDLTGWEGNPDLWRVENGEIVGTSPGLRRNEWIGSQLLLGDFRFSCQVKLTPNEGNSGIQFRSERLPNGEVKGYQADVGVGWWGKLYEEHGRALLWKDSGEKHIKPGEWNHYEIVAVGSRIRTYLNGNLCVDLDDPPGAKQGIIAFQLHSGGKFEVRYKDFKLELNPSMQTAAGN
jgi:putative membrane-bound dehydrogenase-like protein